MEPELRSGITDFTGEQIYNFPWTHRRGVLAGKQIHRTWELGEGQD